MYSYYKNNQEIKNITDKAFVCEIFQKNFYYLNQKIIDKNMAISSLTQQLSHFKNFSTAKQRIQNQLPYRLGQAMIINSKNLLGYLFLPYILLSIVISYKQEQKNYKYKIKLNQELALPPLETYPDYNEALKEKECFTYKLGLALIEANKKWYSGGYIKLWFKIKKLKYEFKNKIRF